jgi:ATP-binding cassette subfamily C (CFTR/MRP) protein 1
VSDLSHIENCNLASFSPDNKMSGHVPLDESVGRPSEAQPPAESKLAHAASNEGGYNFGHYDVENPETMYIRREYSEMMKMMDKASAFAPDESTEAAPSNFAVAGLCSRIFFCWLLPLVRALRTGAKESDQLILGSKDRTSASTNLFLHHWLEETKKPRPSLMRALWNSFRQKFIRALFLKFAWGIGMVVMNSYIIYLFVEEQFNYKASPAARTREYDEGLQWGLAVLFFIIPCCIGFFVHHMESMASRIGVRIRSCLVSAIYSKALKAQITGVALSPILSLMTKDCVIMSQAPIAILKVSTSVLEVVLLLVSLIPFVQWFGILWFLGLCIIVVPVQLWFGKIVTQVRKTNTESNNERVHIVHEILYAIKLVKFYVWEESFSSKVINIRNAELKLLKFAAWIKTLNLAVIISLPPACSVGVFFLYALQGIKLKPMQSFTLLNIANSLRFPLFSLPSNLKVLNEMFAAVRRIQAFLLEPELTPLPEADHFGVEFDDYTFTHRDLQVSEVLLGADEKKTDKVEHAASGPKFTIKNLTLSLKKGEILAIIGSFGSGKSSILRAILGDMETVSGSIKVRGSIAYVPQTPWIMHGTVRDNILFGKAFDKAWYMRVVRACCLLADFRMLEEHDMTFLSEGGINLSGGQRQRIALARAVYAKADVYILDSVLSALDPITGRTVFRRVARGLLKDSAIILVTHNLEVIPQCTRILCM